MASSTCEDWTIKEESSLIDRFTSANRLKEYAIGANLKVPDSIIDSLNEASAFIRGSLRTAKANDFQKYGTRIDKALRELTAITYPTTASTLDAKPIEPTRLMYVLLAVAAVALIVASASYEYIDKSQYLHSSLAISLGVLGALVYFFFNLIGLMREREFDPDAAFEFVVRIILGGILGWLLSLAFPAIAKKSDGTINGSLTVLLPFLAGFSTRLVFGILSQAIRAVETTLGIKNTN